MTHRIFGALALTFVFGAALPLEAAAQTKKKTPAAPAAAAGPKKVSTHGKWDVYVQGGKTKMCYALAKPTKRAPANLRDTEGYVFISMRPAQNVRNEVAIKMGFDLAADFKPVVTMGAAKFTMVANGTDLFVENAAEERTFVAAMRKASTLVVKAKSKRGNDTQDDYSLGSVGAALDAMQKECK